MTLTLETAHLRLRPWRVSEAAIQRELRNERDPRWRRTAASTRTEALLSTTSRVGSVMPLGHRHAERDFRAGRFSYDLAHHAIHVLGSRALGFTQELFEPDDADAGEADATAMLEQMADQYPHIVGMLAEISHASESTLGWCDDQFEFELALDLILDGLERRRTTA